MGNDKENDFVLGICVILAILLGAIETGSLIGPLFLVAGIFFGLPMFWTFYVSKSYEDSFSRFLFMVLAFCLIGAISGLFHK